MKPIYIPHLLTAPERRRTLQIEDRISGLETLTPVRGKLVVTHCGTYLEVAASAEAIVTLTCDRTLQQYNHKLSLDTSEIIWLDDRDNLADVGPGEREVSAEELTESLSSQGHFEPEAWLYEQMCLAMPMRRLNDDSSPVGTYDYRDAPYADNRFAALAVLKEQLSSQN
ncbi:putative metal-binding, possibly nucleic acid-binding protein [Rubidibacter lacunae KORDI 51-2]|uniref:Putative metal-binding, possibly nucleic acid-binding protein n=1 Tax=Rubidibacter lacunae KORDI 51-2 TaxID=582515 RepID=U5DNE4_9CHRO|nr:YceD family protein [Rubidibacter lacunae]ERN42392.1 putative metal-binding, possibly nucleic acid-binding protein [Rubidibacter lacunae KORDI 51-2]